MKNQWKGTEYKRNDYHFPRTSREVYGRQLNEDDFEQDIVTPRHSVHKGDLAVVVLCLAIAVYIIFFGWGG